MTEKNDTEYSVGYGRPPKRTQFKPGQSGNPHGRPRKTSTFADVVITEMNSKIDLTENGKTRKITKLEAIVKRHSLEAIKGNLAAAKMLIDGMQKAQPSEPDSLKAVVNAFEERNRQLADRAADSPPLLDLVGNLPPAPSLNENHND
jgi:Family of unknown function (DUF5681)